MINDLLSIARGFPEVAAKLAFQVFPEYTGKANEKLKDSETDSDSFSVSEITLDELRSLCENEAEFGELSGRENLRTVIVKVLRKLNDLTDEDIRHILWGLQHTCSFNLSIAPVEWFSAAIPALWEIDVETTLEDLRFTGERIAAYYENTIADTVIDYCQVETRDFPW